MPSLDSVALERVRDAALSRTPISLGVRRTASPHEFYRYPARFSPTLAAAAIDAFSSPGDVVADYFVGGGTTVVEARRASRLAIGSDINSLSVFVSSVKTRLYSASDLDQVFGWAERVVNDEPGQSEAPDDDLARNYFRNVMSADTVEHRGVLLGAISRLGDIDSPKARAFARCVLLRTAQWAFDMRRDIPRVDLLRQALVDNASMMTAAARVATTQYRAADKRVEGSGLPRSLVLHRGLPGVAGHRSISRYPAPRLVLTSPPYPGVYVNYHRWKVRGRHETPFPYFLAGQEDGNGLAYYTMSARSDQSLRTYFAKLEVAFADIARMCDLGTHVVQVVGFNDVDDQLGRYLAAMERAGFTETKFDQLATAEDGRLWRDVPGRRWWAHAGGRADIAPHTAREVVLVHQTTR